jgi:predicted ribosome quality control (RQC) complex YloA/Tae2 family protein
LENLNLEKEKIAEAIAEKNEKFFLNGEEKDEKKSQTKKQKSLDAKSKSRNFVSSEGFEILVGKGAKDNDHLTFRVAKSNDLWLHAADYPGSHVVVRSQNRQEIPHTL